MQKKKNFKNGKHDDRNEIEKVNKKFRAYMQGKLNVFIIFTIFATCFLIARLIYITATSEEKYKKQILSQQSYVSKTIPYKRGSILEANGAVLATSEKVYNVIIDSSILLHGKEFAYENPTIDALIKSFPSINEQELRDFIQKNKQKKILAEESDEKADLSKYYKILEKVSYNEMLMFEEYITTEDEKLKKKCKDEGMAYTGSQIRGVWFEPLYVRKYPYNTLASEILGFSGSDNNGMFGVEEFYNDKLNGINGREYGYHDEEEVEKTVKDALNGNDIVTNIDFTIQSITEKYVNAYNEELRDGVKPGPGAENIGVVVMDVKTGAIKGMATNSGYDNSNPYDLSAYYSEEQIEELEKDKEKYSEALNGMWRSFCLSDSFEPGSVMKPFTVAMALETGKITGNEVYTCNGGLQVANHFIHCHERGGHGAVTVSYAIQESCNVAMMHISDAMGSEEYAKYQNIFGFGLKSNVDIGGEARTSSVVHTAETMGVTELATNSFGQGLQNTMIQMAASFSSLVNGGNLYQPQVVDKIINEDGIVIDDIEPVLVKKTISPSTSDKLKEYLAATCVDGTGKKAVPAGYLIGGKTGTSETLPRGNGEYVVSFMGYAPADDPQIAVYSVIDKPNVDEQSLATKYATWLTRDILTEVLPYMNIPMTEALSDEEIKEMEARKLHDVYSFDAWEKNYSDPNNEEGDDQVDSGQDDQVDDGQDAQVDDGQDVE